MKKLIKFNRILSPVKEIAVRNELSVREVKKAYDYCMSVVIKETIKEIIHGKMNTSYFHIMDKIFSLTEEYLDNKRVKELYENQRLSQLNDFSTEKGLHYSNVKRIYSKFNSRLSNSNFTGNRLEQVFHYNPELGKDAFNLTKRYFNMMDNNKLNFK